MTPGQSARLESITAFLESLAHCLNRKLTDAEANRLRSAYMLGWDDGYARGDAAARQAAHNEARRFTDALSERVGAVTSLHEIKYERAGES
jgi:flagellar biosynthesis/type III secretory pathway protein FliH